MKFPPPNNIEFTYAVGDKILEHRDGHWRPAIVMSHAPYRGRAGYYTQWDPLPTDGSSAGGWTYEAHMRPRGV